MPPPPPGDDVPPLPDGLVHIPRSIRRDDVLRLRHVDAPSRLGLGVVDLWRKLEMLKIFGVWRPNAVLSLRNLFMTKKVGE